MFTIWSIQLEHLLTEILERQAGMPSLDEISKLTQLTYIQLIVQLEGDMKEMNITSTDYTTNN